MWYVFYGINMCQGFICLNSCYKHAKKNLNNLKHVKTMIIKTCMLWNMLQIHAMQEKNDSKHFNNSTSKHKNEKKKELACKTTRRENRQNRLNKTNKK